MILFDNVTKRYPSGAIALENVTVKIADGEFVFIVGPSGAGKTTLLRLLIKDTLPTKGSVYMDNLEINKLPSGKVPYLRRKIGFVFQDFKLLLDRTVGENVSLSLDILGMKETEKQGRMSQVLGIVNLEGKENYFPIQLSQGEQQRVAIGRAIAGHTKVLLADEPTGNLDPKTSWEIIKILNEINKTGTTVLMATHNADVVNSMKKRVVKLADGKVIKDEKKSRYE